VREVVIVIKTGLQSVLEERLNLLHQQRVGLISHPAAILPDYTAAVDALLSRGVHLVSLFGMEHGFAGSVGDGLEVRDAHDPRTGLPVYSLYGANKEPTDDMLAEVDLLLYDVQDVGARFYTFISTLYYVLRAAGRTGLPVLVLDRPNPINGVAVEGPLVERGLESFLGMVPIPVRHGLTCGELARYMNGECELDAALTVVPMTGWRRDMWFDQTGLPWAPLSPGMPHLSTATVYPGACFVEGTNLSEGRGTALPFEVAGAPWLDGHRLAQALNRLALPGVRFRPTYFQPSASKHAGSMCGGVQIHVTDRDALSPVAMGLHLLATCRAQAPTWLEILGSSWEGRPPHLDLLAGTAAVREWLMADRPIEDLAAAWAEDVGQFIQVRRPYLLYGV
jgi:uncharacterized protein YbbC (DUF1343 family)